MQRAVSNFCKHLMPSVVILCSPAVVQSTDKNFMVPVGGAVVVSPSAAFIDTVAAAYPGRASMTPILDLFITLLSMGQTGYRHLLQERLRLREAMLVGLQALCDKHALALLPAPGNRISTGVSLTGLLGRDRVAEPSQEENSAIHLAPALRDMNVATSVAAEMNSAERSGNDKGQDLSQDTPIAAADSSIAASPPAQPPVKAEKSRTESQAEKLSFLGSMLYQRCVSGCRVVTCTGETKKVSGMYFTDWGAHSNAYPHSYFTVACSIGIQERDVTVFLERLDKVLAKFKRQYGGGAEPSTDVKA
jgi:O-phospho-L-seryl-tRNASec:L-selenocysteinyl-tRNA synthase